jgi:hypothetical protein
VPREKLVHWPNALTRTTHQWPAPRLRSGGGLGVGVMPQALPLAGCKLQDQLRRMRRDALDDIMQIHERIDMQMLARLHICLKALRGI